MIHNGKFADAIKQVKEDVNSIVSEKSQSSEGNFRKRGEGVTFFITYLTCLPGDGKRYLRTYYLHFWRSPFLLTETEILLVRHIAIVYT